MTSLQVLAVILATGIMAIGPTIVIILQSTQLRIQAVELRGLIETQTELAVIRKLLDDRTTIFTAMQNELVNIHDRSAIIADQANEIRVLTQANIDLTTGVQNKTAEIAALVQKLATAEKRL